MCQTVHSKNKLSTKPLEYKLYSLFASTLHYGRNINKRCYNVLSGVNGRNTFHSTDTILWERKLWPVVRRGVAERVDMVRSLTQLFREQR